MFEPPPPFHTSRTGAQGLELIAQVAQLVSQAIANKEDLEALRDRAAELMDILIEKHVVGVCVRVCACVCVYAHVCVCACVPMWRRLLATRPLAAMPPGLTLLLVPAPTPQPV